jgi:cellobiose phosphorylase
MAGLAGRLGRDSDAEEMREVARTMTSRINEHAWDGEWYIYAINDSGEPIGSAGNPEGTIHLNANTWAIFTGVARAAGREEAVWKAIDEKLATPVGHLLLWPPYTRESRGSVGRIADQLPGMFENGAIYTHGESFYLHALILAGRSDDCYRALKKSLPSSLVPDIATGPRHQQSNFTVGPDHPAYGAQLFSGFTGSLAWYRRVIEIMLGVYADFDGLVIDPRAPSEWNDYEVRKVFRGRSVRVAFRRTGGPLRVTLRGKEFDGSIPASELSEDGENPVEVEF